MGRPANTDSAETRARIRRVAARLFAARGEAGTSMRQVARGARVTIGTVHHHFGDKAGLYRACVDAMYEEFEAGRAALAPAGVGASSLAEHVAGAVRRSYRFCLAHREAVRLATREAVDQGGMDPRRRAGLLLPALGEATPLLAALTGRDEEELRLVVRSVTLLVVRYAITGPEELADVVGRPAPAPGAAGAEARAALEERVERHLVEVALALVGLGAGAGGGS